MKLNRQARLYMIRHAIASDAAAIWAVRMAAIQSISTQYYTEAQLKAWCAERTVASYLQPIREKIVLVALFRGNVMGYAQLDPKLGEVQALYVHPKHGGRGIGTALLQALTDQAQARGIVELHLESSLNAVGFYAKAGYRQKSSPQPTRESVTMVRRLGVTKDAV